MKIGFIGTGHITKSVIHGILGSKLKIRRIIVSKRNNKISSSLKRKSKKILVLNNKQKYLIAQLKDLGVKAGKLRADLDQVQRAADSFQKDLLDSFKEKAEEVLDEKAS